MHGETVKKYIESVYVGFSIVLNICLLLPIAVIDVVSVLLWLTGSFRNAVSVVVFVVTMGKCLLNITGAFLTSKFPRVLNVVCFLLGNYQASELYMPTFRNTLCSFTPTCL